MASNSATTGLDTTTILARKRMTTCRYCRKRGHTAAECRSKLAIRQEHKATENNTTRCETSGATVDYKDLTPQSNADQDVNQENNSERSRNHSGFSEVTLGCTPECIAKVNSLQESISAMYHHEGTLQAQITDISYSNLMSQERLLVLEHNLADSNIECSEWKQKFQILEAKYHKVEEELNGLKQEFSNLKNKSFIQSIFDPITEHTNDGENSNNIVFESDHSPALMSVCLKGADSTFYQQVLDDDIQLNFDNVDDLVEQYANILASESMLTPNSEDGKVSTDQVAKNFAETQVESPQKSTILTRRRVRTSCNYCGKRGHISSVCWYKPENQQELLASVETLNERTNTIDNDSTFEISQWHERYRASPAKTGESSTTVSLVLPKTQDVHPTIPPMPTHTTTGRNTAPIAEPKCSIFPNCERNPTGKRNRGCEIPPPEQYSSHPSRLTTPLRSDRGRPIPDTFADMHQHDRANF